MLMFKESVRNKLMLASNEYMKLVGFTYVIESNEFEYRSEYRLRFHKDNFLHLTGVITNLKANDFFDKCFDGTISLNDFDCDSSTELKGKIKEKLKNLLTIGTFFNKELVFQEMFEKNRVKCKLATSDGKCTLGFISINKTIHVPLTLLNKNQIKKENQISCFSVRKFVNSILTIEQIKERMQSVIEKHGIKDVYLFGSYAREEANSDSDIDIYCEKGDVDSLFKDAAFRSELEEALGKKVDVVTIGSRMSDAFKEQIDKDKIKIF